MGIAAIATCVIVVSGGMNGDIWEKLVHEEAHCNGWVHPDKPNAFGKAYWPPRHYRHAYRGKIVVRNVTTVKAMRLCDGHFGCQYFK